jgi:hypothetical protein
MNAFGEALACATLMALAAQCAHAQKVVTWQDILDDQRTTTDVVSYGLGPRAQRYSALTKVSRENVGRLVPAWSYPLGGESERGQEAQPLVHDGTIFVTASYSRVFAFDARTGRKIWQYDHALPDGLSLCCDVVNRGAALYDDLVLFGTLDVAVPNRVGRHRLAGHVGVGRQAIHRSGIRLGRRSRHVGRRSRQTIRAEHARRKAVGVPPGRVMWCSTRLPRQTLAACALAS